MSNSDLQDLKDSVHTRLISRREIDFGTGCWVWTGAWQKESGLGVIRIQKRLFTVSRAAFWVYKRHFDLWDTSLRVLHRCEDCPACFNPEHLMVVEGQAGVQSTLNKLGRRGRQKVAACSAAAS